MNNIPIYRAKKVNSDEYIEGSLIKAENRGFCILTKELWDDERYSWHSTDRDSLFQIIPSTLSINFPDMLDSEGNKIFVSLSEDGKNGVIVEHKKYELPKKVNQNIEVDSFNRHGFETPDFEGEILKQLDNGTFIGYVVDNRGFDVAQKWSACGLTLQGNIFDLTPIKKPWYEDESNFPILLKAIESDNYVSMGNKKRYINYIESGKWRPATKDEVLSLLIKE